MTNILSTATEIGESRAMKKQNQHISYNDYVLKLSEKLRTLRKEAGISQEKVASAAWIARFTYRKYERAESNINTPMNPEISTLIALANVFDISVLELLDVDGDQAHIYKSDTSDESTPNGKGASPNATSGAADTPSMPSTQSMQNAANAQNVSSTLATQPNCSQEAFAKGFAERLQQLRWERDLSQERMAALAGLSSNSYYLMEKGESRPGTPANPHLKTLIGLANAFEISLVEMLDFACMDTSDDPPAQSEPDPAGDDEWLTLV